MTTTQQLSRHRASFLHVPWAQGYWRQGVMSLSPMVMRRLTREIAHLQRSPPDGIAIQIGEHDLLDIGGWIQGPAGTPYAGGYFRVGFNFLGSDFPAGPPRCTMQTKVFHPNIAANGEICVSTLKKDWSSSYGIEHILIVIKCLLISPNPDSALDPEAGRLLQDAYADYAATAAIWTRVHASRRPDCLPLDPQAPSGSQGGAAPAPIADVEPPTASFQALALHPAKKREMSPKSTSAACGDVESSSGTQSVPSLGVSVAQPLMRSGSMNAGLRHKPSFDIEARRSHPSAPTDASGVVASAAVTTLAAAAATLPAMVTVMTNTAREVSAPAATRATAAPLSTLAPLGTTVRPLYLPCTDLNVETDRVTKGLRNVSLGQPMSHPLAAPSVVTLHRRPVAVVRRGIKRL